MDCFYGRAFITYEHQSIRMAVLHSAERVLKLPRMNPPVAELASLLSRYRVQTIGVGGIRAAERFDEDKEVRAVMEWLEYLRASGSQGEPEGTR